MSSHLAVDGPLLVVALLLLVGAVAAAVADKVRAPGLLATLGLGMLIGDDGLALIRFDDAELAQTIAVVALAIILFEGGLTSPVEQLRPVAGPALALATVGVAITAAIIGLAAAPLFGLGAAVALLLGSVVASTDAAAVFSVLPRAPVPRRVALLLQAESGANDPMAVLLTIGLIEVITGDVAAGEWVVFGARQLGGGLVVGGAVGAFGALLLRRLPLPGPSLQPVVGLATAGCAYGGATALGASGFLAAYLAGVAIATLAPGRRRAVRTFHAGLAQAAEIALFLLLGLLVFPSRLLDDAIPALVLATALVFVARPVAVAVALAPFRWRPADVTIVAWGGLRGAVPIVLATFPLTAGIDEGQLLFEVVFFVVLVSTAVQGLSMAAVARRLAPWSGPEEAPPALAEVVPVDVAGVEVVEVVVPRGSAVAGHPLARVPLPGGARISVLVRDNDVVVPDGTTELCAGDRLVVLSSSDPGLADRIEAWLDG